MVGLPSSGPVGLEGAQWEAERGSRQPCHPATILLYPASILLCPATMPSILSYNTKSTILLCLVYYPTMLSLLSYYASSTILLCQVYYPTMPPISCPIPSLHTIPSHVYYASDIQPIYYTLVFYTSYHIIQWVIAMLYFVLQSPISLHPRLLYQISQH